MTEPQDYAETVRRGMLPRVNAPKSWEALDTLTARLAELNSTVAYLQRFWVPEKVQEVISERDSLRTRLAEVERERDIHETAFAASEAELQQAQNTVRLAELQIATFRTQLTQAREALEQAMFHIDNHDHTAQDCGPVAIARQALATDKELNRTQRRGGLIPTGLTAEEYPAATDKELK